MAEAFGVVAGAMGIAGLFNNCVDCFEYITLARNFDRDFQTAQLRLDLARVRFTRWGEVVGVNPRSGLDIPSRQAQEVAAKVLWQIFVLFDESARVSDKFSGEQQQRQTPLTGSGTAPTTLAVDMYDPGADRSVVELHSKLSELARRRKRRVGLVAKAKWALHRGKYLDRLIDQITSLVDQLFTLVEDDKDAPRRTDSIVADEIATFSLPELRRIKEIAADTDNLLCDRATQEVKKQDNSHTLMHLEQRDRAKAQVGDVLSDAALSQLDKLRGLSRSHVGVAKQADDSKLLVGSSIGDTSRSVFDN